MRNEGAPKGPAHEVSRCALLHGANSRRLGPAKSIAQFVYTRVQLENSRSGSPLHSALNAHACLSCRHNLELVCAGHVSTT